MMIDTQSDHDSLDGYDVVEATIRDFRKSVQRYQKHPDNDSYLWDVFKYMQFMQSDEFFDMLSYDVNDLIDTILAHAGMTQADVVSHAYHSRRYMF